METFAVMLSYNSLRHRQTDVAHSPKYVCRRHASLAFPRFEPVVKRPPDGFGDLPVIRYEAVPTILGYIEQWEKAAIVIVGAHISLRLHTFGGHGKND